MVEKSISKSEFSGPYSFEIAERTNFVIKLTASDSFELSVSGAAGIFAYIFTFKRVGNEYFLFEFADYST